MSTKMKLTRRITGLFKTRTRTKAEAQTETETPTHSPVETQTAAQGEAQGHVQAERQTTAQVETQITAQVEIQTMAQVDTQTTAQTNRNSKREAHMHVCLMVDEILRHILAFIAELDVPFDMESFLAPEQFPWQPKPNTIVSGTLLAMAVVCKLFREPALDQLWATQSGLGNLVKLLPADILEESMIENLWEADPRSFFPTTFLPAAQLVSQQLE